LLAFSSLYPVFCLWFMNNLAAVYLQTQIDSRLCVRFVTGDEKAQVDC